MKTHCTRSELNLLKLCFVFLPLFVCGSSSAQMLLLSSKTSTIQPGLFDDPSVNIKSGAKTDPFGSGTKFIQNIGQYGTTLARHADMGEILYGYEGSAMPVLFTPKGLIHLQRKIKKPKYHENEKPEKGSSGEKDRSTPIDLVVTLKWVNANSNPQIIPEDLSMDYFTYGMFTEKARAFRKITYKELYPGIDLVYTFDQTKNTGFEFSLLVAPGADLSNVKMKYGGDIKNISQGKDGKIIINTGIDKITINAASNNRAATNGRQINLLFSLYKNEVSLAVPGDFRAENPQFIGPFETGTGTLSGLDAGKAKDIDYDYNGNIYVSGGGDGSIQKLAKYDAAGVLLWTFSGSLTVPMWNFGEARGGFVAEKISGSLYLGQGIKQSGFSIIRLNTAGLYDNYKTSVDPGFVENWKMLWNCNAGIPKIFIAGGGGNSNKELAILSPPSTDLSPSNLTGIASGHNDISDILIDPVSNDMYTLFSISVLDPTSDNKIYKHKPSYSNSDKIWAVEPGYFNLKEPFNRPYLNGLDNSSNTLALNSRYLFYWDGRNLTAFNKSDGTVAGTAISIASNAPLMQGGIIADECDNVYAGSANGTIKVYHFNGNTFDDGAADDIMIAGYLSSSVYDITYDEGRSLLYACGDGFVASVDLSAYCTSKVYTVNIIASCNSVSVTASVDPVPPVGSVVTYNLFEGGTQIDGNTSGSFTGLTSGSRYSIKAFINQACGGIQTAAEFTAGSPATINITDPSAICYDSTVDLTAASVTAGSTSGLIYSYWLDAAATIPYDSPAKAKAGTYYIKGSTTSGCSVIEAVTVTGLKAPEPYAGPDTVICFGNSMQLHGQGGLSYYWSPSTYLDDPGIATPTVEYPGSGVISYRLKVKDAFGCMSVTEDEVKISFAPAAKILIDSDSLVAAGQPLQLHAVDLNNSGFVNFLWSPAQGLNNPFIANPIAILDREMTYTLHASTAANCADEASITVTVFQRPEIYVPNSFTPNGDGLNDVLRATPVGLQEFHYLKVFNRFGQLLFTSISAEKGWDGKINGKILDYGTFIWIGEGIDFKGNIIQRKGSFILLR